VCHCKMNARPKRHDPLVNYAQVTINGHFRRV
jgi:hypothetical protein